MQGCPKVAVANPQFLRGAGTIRRPENLKDDKQGQGHRSSHRLLMRTLFAGGLTARVARPQPLVLFQRLAAASPQQKQLLSPLNHSLLQVLCPDELVWHGHRYTALVPGSRDQIGGEHVCMREPIKLGSLSLGGLKVDWDKIVA